MNNPITRILNKISERNLSAKIETLEKRLVDAETKNQALSKERVQTRLKRYRQVMVDIGQEDLRLAILIAENIYYPRRYELLLIYKEAMRDFHLRSQVNTSIFKVISEPWAIVEKKTKKVDERRTELLKKKWFADVSKFMLEADPFGKSVMEFGLMKPTEDENADLAPFEFDKVTLIPREHVRPETGELLISPWDTIGIPYREAPFNTWLLEAGDDDDLGYLHIAAKYAIYKKFALSDWSISSEKWADPLLIIQSASDDDTENDKKQEWAENFGKNRYGIFDKDDGIELLEGKGSGSGNGHKIYMDFINLLNEENSKGVNGQTASSDQKSFVGAAEVQERILEDYTQWRLANLFYFHNDKTLPFLIEKGYDLKGYYWMPLRILAEMTKKENPDGNPPPDPKNPTNKNTPGAQGGAAGKKLRFSPDSLRMLSEFHEQLTLSQTCTCGEIHTSLDYNTGLNVDEYIQRALDRLYQRKLAAGDTDADLVQMNTSSLWDAVKAGFGTEPDNLVYGSSAHKLMLQMRYNIAVTAVFKNYKNQLEMAGLLFDANGNLRSKAEFLKAARPIAELYNKTYLSTEYDTARASARMGKQWQDYAARGGMLQYVTVGDARVRDEHKILNGTLLPVEHIFWNNWYPPNGWNCRCTVIWHPDGTVEVQPAGLPDIPEMFRNNVGKTGMIFTPQTPYFANTAHLKGAHTFFGNKMPISPSQLEYNTIKYQHLSKDKEYKAVFVDNLSGGFVFKNVKANPKELEALLPVTNLLASQKGDAIVIRRVLNKPGMKNPDIEINGIVAEVKTNNTATANAIDNALRVASKQANIIVLNIESDISIEMLETAIYKRVQRAVNITEVQVIYGGELYTLKRAEIINRTFLGKIK